MFGGDEFILKPLRFLKCRFENLICAGRNHHPHLHSAVALNLRQGIAEPLGFAQDAGRLHAALLEHRPHDPVTVFQQRRQQVQRMDSLIAVLLRNALRALHGLLRFLG